MTAPRFVLHHLVAFLLFTGAAPAQNKTENVILITLDGASCTSRWAKPTIGLMAAITRTRSIPSIATTSN